MKQIVCITGLISQPRFVKRVQTLLMADYDVTVYGYSRDGYNVNNLPKSIKVINKGVQKMEAIIFRNLLVAIKM